MMVKRAVTLALMLNAASAPSLLAQGTIGGQGFGYPAGQMGARAAGTAGALAALDAVSPVNPATLAGWQRAVVFYHAEPERRSTSVNGAKASTRVSRFPLVGGAMHVGSAFTLGLSASTYLDRTWETRSNATDIIGGEAVDVTTLYASDGAINDVRFGGAWAVSPKFHIGAAIHAYTGENRMRIGWDFPDSLSFGDVSQTSTISYSGGAFSLGAEWQPQTKWAFSGYVRRGGSGRMRVADTLITRGDFPDHVGFAVRYSGISGTTLAAAWERIAWSAMRSFGTADLAVRDGDRVSIGAETRGPELARVPVFLRAGYSNRTLPFDAVGSRARESVFSFGTGYAIAQGRASLDIALQRAHRDAGAASERAWLFMFGLAISP